MSDLSLFVSHVSEDRAAAMALVEELEKRGVRCWIAPRNIRPGRPFDDEIAAAIEACRAMLLIFSERCNESEYIRREVTVAGESQKIVIPFRIENAQPKRGLRVRLSDLNWIDGFVSRENAIDELVRNFKAQDDQQRLDTDVRQQAEAEQGRQRDEAAERQRLEEQQRQSAAEALRQSEQERAALEARQRQQQEGREKAVAAQRTADVGSKDDKPASAATAKKSSGSVAAWIGVVLLTVVAAIFLIVVVAAVFPHSPSQPPAVAAAPQAPTSAPADPPMRAPVNPPASSFHALASLAIADCNVYRLSGNGPVSKAAVIFADGAPYNAVARTARAKLKALSIAVVYDQAYSTQPPWFLVGTAKTAGAQALVQCGPPDEMLALMTRSESPEN